MRNALSVARRPWGIGFEVGFVGLVLVIWQLARIPLEGGTKISVEHAGSWLGVEEALRIDFESDLIALVDRLGADGVLDWMYGNVHVPVLFGFMAAARLLAPQRYPLVRTTYVLSFFPALLIIGLYPLAPPHWLPRFDGYAPTDEDLTGTIGVLLENSTAAAASQHFAFAVLVAAASLWLWPRSRLTLVALVYPAVVFVIIVGTGQHYVLDCVIGTLTLVAAVLVAQRFHRAVQDPAARETAHWSLAFAAVGYGLCAWSVEALHENPGLTTVALIGLVGALAALFGPRAGRALATYWQPLSPAGDEAGAYAGDSS